MNRKITTLEMEIAVAKKFNYRQNVIVPRLGWGMMNNKNTPLHECDLFILTPKGYGWEVEIKISRTDLLKDKNKVHGHKDKRIKYFYFAIPDYLLKYKDCIPKQAGILLVMYHEKEKEFFTKIIRKSENNSSYIFTDAEQFNIARLGAMRIWRLKEKLQSIECKG